MSVNVLLNLADLPRDALSKVLLGYTETYRALDLREAIAGAYERLSASDILCIGDA